MQEKLVIVLQSPDFSRPSWAVINADALERVNAGSEHTVIVRQSAINASADGLAQLAEGKQVIVVVPAEDVLITSVKLPKMNRSRLLQALPFALEEQLIEDLDKLHFAPGRYQEDELAVAVVARDKMQQWLGLLQTWQIKPDSMISAVFTLPVVANQWQAVIHADTVVRTQSYAGFACDKNNFVEYLQIALTSVVPLPQSMHIYNYSSHAYASALAGTMRIEEELLSEEKWIVNLAKNAVSTPAIDLLQNEFMAKRARLPQMAQVWKTVTRLAATFVFLLFLTPILSYFILNQRVSAAEDEIAAIYKKHFPEASSVVAPKLRMEEKLHKLSAQMGENKLLVLLGYVGKGMLETPNIKLKHFDFQGNQLTLELTAASSEDFAAFTDFLTRNGLSVRQQNANLVGTRVNATLQVE